MKVVKGKIQLVRRNTKGASHVTTMASVHTGPFSTLVRIGNIE